MDTKQFYGYWWENKIDGAMYIGKGSGDRIDKHLELYKRPSSKDNCRKFYNAINKYGPENFERLIFAYCDSEDEAFEEEKYWIKRLRAFGIKVYNISSGGRGGKAGGKSTLGKSIFSESEQKEICDEYIQIYNVHKIAKRLGCASSTIIHVLTKHNIQRLDGRKFAKPDIEAEVCGYYTEYKRTVLQLSAQFGCIENTIVAILKRHGIYNERKVKIDYIKSIEQDICMAYKKVKQIKILQKQFQLSYNSIVRVLKRHKVFVNKLNKFSYEEEIVIYKEYKAGAKYSLLAARYNAGYSCIRNIVRRHEHRERIL